VNKKTTLIQVAELANVSPASASMILNNRNSSSFSDETVKKVIQAADELGYVKKNKGNSASCTFLTKQTVVIICPTVISPYYATLVQSIEQSARLKGFDTLIYNTYRDPEKELQLLSFLKGSDIAGILFTIIPQAKQLVEEINSHIPVVVIGDRDDSVNIDTVETSNYSAGVLMARYLLQLGHKNIAFISTTLNQSNTARTKRLEGIKDTFANECPEGAVLVKSWDIKPQEELQNLFLEHTVGYELCKASLCHSELTAFVGVNDMVAYGILDALNGSGYKVPEDYSVCGFDNNFPSAFSSVSLTSVDQCIQDKAHNAFDRLCEKITQPSEERLNSSDVITRVEYRQKLVVRNSTNVPRSFIKK